MEDIKKIDTLILIKELCERDKKELELGIFLMLLNKKIDFTSISESYVKTLEKWNEHNKMKIMHSNTCLLSNLIVMKNTKKTEKSIKESLFILEKSKQFNLNDLSSKLGINIGDLNATDCVNSMFSELYK